MAKYNVTKFESIINEDNINYKKLAKFIGNNDPKWSAKKMFEEEGFWMQEAVGSYSRAMCDKLNITEDDIEVTLNIVKENENIIVGMNLNYERINEHGEKEYANLTFINKESCEVWYQSSGGYFEIRTGDFEITRLNFFSAYKNIAFAI